MLWPPVNDLIIQRRSGARILEINRPDRANALRRGTIRRLADTLREIERQIEGQIENQTAGDESPGGVVITGAGGRFSAGADLAELTGTIADAGFDDELESLTTAIASHPLPVIAAVEGSCVGAAVDLAWSCDAVVVSRTARIALPATRLGILYNPSALARLHARMGAMLLRRLVVLGDEIGGPEVAAGGAAVLVEDGTAVSEAVQLLARTGGAGAAGAATKALLASLDTGSFDASAWEEQRRVLLAAPERLRALEDRRDSLKG